MSIWWDYVHAKPLCVVAPKFPEKYRTSDDLGLKMVERCWKHELWRHVLKHHILRHMQPANMIFSDGFPAIGLCTRRVILLSTWLEDVIVMQVFCPFNIIERHELNPFASACPYWLSCQESCICRCQCSGVLWLKRKSSGPQTFVDASCSPPQPFTQMSLRAPSAFVPPTSDSTPHLKNFIIVYVYCFHAVTQPCFGYKPQKSNDRCFWNW